ncbi:XRE family transcriptional regulator [Variovorax sp. PCZ-1]|uniref:helix-turn-helix domain-containing protein n=1 Tax=Variovorax sp. PCZ-1 TaxID=2835533 RepID=UPI001BCF350D|nr:XRE family transcriptional regulator [Variovorax sp. PCZ-1]MBS7806861.1 helix-turn-helix transcriptional regulator [Variovorax sp. PCZ-1]
MKEKSTQSNTLDERIAQRVRYLRDARSLSLDQLAQRSGVSRSMISLIERGQASPTAVVLEKIANGLGVALASLFEAEPDQQTEKIIARASTQGFWQDPASGYMRRNVSPAQELGGQAPPVHIVEVKFPAKTRVMYDGLVQGAVLHQQIWLLSGQMQITLGDQVHDLKAGDCLAHRLDRPITYFNPGTQTARYAVLITR